MVLSWLAQCLCTPGKMINYHLLIVSGLGFASAFQGVGFMFRLRLHFPGAQVCLVGVRGRHGQESGRLSAPERLKDP